MAKPRRLFWGGMFGIGLFVYLLFVCGGLLALSLPMGVPGAFLLLLIYGWVLYAFVQYRQGRQQELTYLLCTATESQAPLAPALWAYLDDRPRSTLREFWTALFLFFLLPGYYWVWHRRHRFEQKVARVAHHLEMGESLPDALAASPGAVARGTILAARIGMETGRLAESLRSSLPSRLTALWLEMAPRFLYPLMLIFFMAGLTTFWMTNVFPKMQRIYDDFGLELPDATLRLVRIERFAADKAGILVLIVLMAIALGALLISSSWICWHFPVLGRVYRRHQQSNVLKLLSALLRVDMPTPRAVEVLATSQYFDRAVQGRLIAVGNQLQQGVPLAETLHRNRLLPRSMVALVQAAERVRNLPWALGELGESMAERTVRSLRRFSQLFGPLLVMAVGLLVAVEVLGIFMPVIDIVTRLAE
jgi:type IV pilus assembly protein PilC